MSILACFEAFRGGLDYALALGGYETPVRMELGERHLDLLEEYIGQGQNKPMIIWVPLGAAKIEQIGSLRDGVSALRPQGISQPVRIATRDEQIDAFIWAKDFSEAERLMNHFVATCRLQATAHSFHPLSTKWSVGDDPRKPKQGTLVILRFWVKIPFTAEPDQIAHAPFTPNVTGEFVEHLTLSTVDP
jgi:hypothetical protein